MAILEHYMVHIAQYSIPVSGTLSMLSLKCLMKTYCDDLIYRDVQKIDICLLW